MTYQIEQADGAGVAGEGKALDGAWVNVPITISGTVGYAAYEHTFRDKPLGSSSVFTSADQRVATFTPDVAGDTYRVRLREKATATSAWITTTKVIRVTKDETGAVVNHGITSCAFEEIPSEANYGNNEVGYRQRTTANDRAIVAKFDEVDTSIGDLEALPGEIGSLSGRIDDAETSIDTQGAAIDAQGERLDDAESVIALMAERAEEPQTTLPTTSSTAAAAFRRYIAPPSVVTPTVITTHVVEDGTYDGQTKTIERRISNRSRIRFVGEDGKHIAWLNRTMTVPIKWSESEGRWLPLVHADNVKVFYPEDFGDNVGVGDATADRAALVACFAAVTDLDPIGSASNELACKIVLGTMYYVNEGVDLAGTDYTSITIEGVGGAGATGGVRGCGIFYAGPAPAVMSGSPTLTFNRAARTIQRSAGSWITDNFAAGQRIYVANPAQTSIQNNRFYVIESVTTSTITVAAPSATYPAVPFDTAGMMPFTEGPIANFAVVQVTNCLRVKGASGVTLHNVVVQGDNKALIPLLFDIVPDDPNATNMMSPRVERCTVYGSYDHVLGTLIQFGRPGSNPAVGSDLNNTWVQDCFIANLYAADRLSAGIRYADGNNTKLHRVLRCQIHSCSRGVDHESASEGLSVQDTHFENCSIAVYNNGYAEVANCHSERTKQTIYGTRGRCLETNNSWNLDGAVIVARQRFHKLVSTNYYNGTTWFSSLSIDLVTNVVTGSNNVARVPQNGDVVVVRSDTGFDGCPGMLHPTWNDPALQVYYLADVTLVSGVVYTFTLREGSVSGTVVDFTSAGTDVHILSPSIFETNTGLNKPSGDGYSVSFDSCIILGAEDLPMVGSSATQLTMDPFFGYQLSGIGRVSVRNCSGFTPGPVFRALQEVASVPMFGNAQLVPQVTYYAENCRWVARGINGWSTLRIRASQLAVGTFRAGATMLLYVDLPWRCGIEAVVSEVITPFAGPGLTTATVKVGHYDIGQGDGNDDDAFLLATSLMTFANTSDRRKGFLGAEKGTRIATGTYWPKYAGVTDWGWANRYVVTVQIDVTGCTLSQLTAGDLLVHFKIVQIPDWRRT